MKLEYRKYYYLPNIAMTKESWEIDEFAFYVKL